MRGAMVVRGGEHGVAPLRRDAVMGEVRLEGGGGCGGGEAGVVDVERVGVGRAVGDEGVGGDLVGRDVEGGEGGEG